MRRREKGGGAGMEGFKRSFHAVASIAGALRICMDVRGVYGE